MFWLASSIAVRAVPTNAPAATSSFSWSEADMGRAFDAFWREMDLNYSYFHLKTNVDWGALGKQFRPQAVKARNGDELAAVLQKMLEPLQDLHIWIDAPRGRLGTHLSSFTYNGNAKLTYASILDPTPCGRFAVVGKAEGFGYLMILRQVNATDELVHKAIGAINNLKDVPGFVIDLRAADGGNEMLAQLIAQRFCATNTVYAKSKYRNGPAHQDFTQSYERILKAGPSPFTKPVVCIIGPGAVSSGEGFVKMLKALPNVTTIGLPTRGASGNPKPYALAGTGVTVTFSRWVDMMPNGETFEGRGIPPDVLVNEPASAYVEDDPTLRQALMLLRQKIAESAPTKPATIPNL